MSSSIWGPNVHQAPAEERMTEFTSGLDVHVELEVTPAPQPEEPPVEDPTEEGE